MPDPGSASTPVLTPEPGKGPDTTPPAGATTVGAAREVSSGSSGSTGAGPDAAPDEADAVRVDEVRVLDGPNLYFARPAIKVSLRLHGYLSMRRTEAEALARRLGMRNARPGRRGTALRQRFVMRVIRTVTKRVGSEIGVGRLGVRVRAGQTVDDVVVAFPWVHRTRGQVAGEQIGEMLAGLLDESRRPGEVIEAAGAVILAAPDGPAPSVLTPRVPVASVTGTNGKTTTTRLMAHMCMTAGLRTAWSSTDGIVVMGETKEEGDFSGPAGARGVLETPGLEVGILETARGGMLLKGMGVTRNDVSVVTNVTPTTSACTASTPSTSSPRSRPSSPPSRSRTDGSSSTATTPASGRCGTASRPSPGRSASTRPRRPSGSRSTRVVAASPCSMARSSCCRRTATPTGSSRSWTSR